MGREAICSDLEYCAVVEIHHSISQISNASKETVGSIFERYNRDLHVLECAFSMSK